MVGGLAGAAALAGLAGCATKGSETGGSGRERVSGGRMPVVFVPHGGGPWPFVDVGFFRREEMEDLATYLRDLRGVTPAKPRALLVVSAHWEERVPTVMTAERPPMFYDYYGFPPAAYEIQWPAPGSPALAARVRELLSGAGMTSAEDPRRGFDHGTFIPLKLTYPDADLPTTQLSLKVGLDPEEHLAIGRALAPLRDEGVFIVGSGMSYHNMREMRGPRAREGSMAFDAWLRETATMDPAARDERLAAWHRSPAGRRAHPREEHLLPLMVCAGAAGADRGWLGFDGLYAGMKLSAVHFGSSSA